MFEEEGAAEGGVLPKLVGVLLFGFVFRLMFDVEEIFDLQGLDFEEAS